MDVNVLVSYQVRLKPDELMLNAIRFFYSEEELLQYINNENLKLEFENDFHGKSIIESLMNLIKEYLSGKKVDFISEISKLNVKLELKTKFCTEFSQKVIQEVLKIKFGETSTYSTIGDRIGSKAYRAVGNVLRSNPIPLIVPCHRVIQKHGGLGGFMGSTDNGLPQQLKKNLLKLEGVKINL